MYKILPVKDCSKPNNGDIRNAMRKNPKNIVGQ